MIPSTLQGADEVLLVSGGLRSAATTGYLSDSLSGWKPVPTASGSDYSTSSGTLVATPQCGPYNLMS